MLTIKMAWYEEKHVFTCKGEDLIGKKLKLIADKPPIPSQKFSGMSQLTVMNADNSISYKVLVTSIDLDIAVKSQREGLAFTFTKNPQDKYARIVPVKPVIT